MKKKGQEKKRAKKCGRGRDPVSRTKLTRAGHSKQRGE